MIMSLLDSLLRWIHLVVGILWIGHLYFFNFVNGPFQGTLDAESKKKVNPELLPRALYWFRWGAAWTFITGVLLLFTQFYHAPTNLFTSGEWSVLGVVFVLLTFLSFHGYDVLVQKVTKTQQHFVLGVVWSVVWVFLIERVGGFGFRGAAIHLGVMFGTWMAANVWFRIWPAQKRIITAVKAGQAPDPKDPAMAGLRSKHNTYMSVPLMFLMLNQHMQFFATRPVDFLAVNLGLVVLVAWGATYWLYKKAAQVKGF